VGDEIAHEHHQSDKTYGRDDKPPDIPHDTPDTL
jgi:hypothetical protein